MQWLKLVSIEFRFPGCRSLKEQRQRLGGLKDRVGKQSGFAITQHPGLDQPDRAQWSVAVLASDAQQSQRLMALLEKTVLSCVDGEIIHWEEDVC